MREEKEQAEKGMKMRNNEKKKAPGTDEETAPKKERQKRRGITKRGES